MNEKEHSKMARKYNNAPASIAEQVESTFPSVGNYGTVVNSSALDTGNTMMAPRDPGRPAADVPGTGTWASRRPVEINVQSGQEMADSTQAALESRWPLLSVKRQAMADALQDASNAQYMDVGYTQPRSHIAASMRNDHLLARLHGNPGETECCNG